MSSRPVFDGGVNVAVKIPLDRYDKTITFYRDVLGFELTPYFHEYTGQSHYCRFGTLTLWFDRVDHFSQTDIWFELNTDDIHQARTYLSENGVNFRPELEKLPDDMKGNWMSDPAGVVLLLKEDERLKKTDKMDAVFKKLNLKNQKAVVVVNGPDSFQVNLDSIRDETTVIDTLEGLSEIEFILLFVTRQSEIDHLIPTIAPLLKGDALLWMCYPKGTSKKYKCDFNRDTGWQIMGNYDLEPVRMVAIDEDWSALRFKKVEFIKTMTRASQHALSEKGKIKSGQGNCK